MLLKSITLLTIESLFLWKDPLIINSAYQSYNSNLLLLRLLKGIKIKFNIQILFKN